jgi:hypothetical protein
MSLIKNNKRTDVAGHAEVSFFIIQSSHQALIDSFD